MKDSTDTEMRQLLAEVQARGYGDTEWEQQIAELERHVDLTALARTHGALVRRRAVREAPCLLRMVLAYAVCDWSLSQVAMWCAIKGWASLSKVAVRKRLQGCEAWLGQLLGQLLAPDEEARPHVRVRILDTTAISRPGSRGTDWRIHASWDLETLSITDVAVTPTGKADAETLGRFPLRHDEIVLADQGFAYGASLEPLLQGGFPCVVRCNWRSIRLEDAKGQRVEVTQLMRSLAPRQLLERPVWVVHNGARYPMRLIIGALPQAQADRARQRVRENRRRKGTTPKADTLLTAGFTLLLTNLPLVEWPAQRILDLYRWRWHIEVHFKRLKSLLHLDHLRARNPQLARVYLLAKLLAAVLTDRAIRGIQRTCPEWFQSTHRPLNLSQLTSLLYLCLQHRVIGPLNLFEILAALPTLHRFLCASPRRRTPQLARAQQCLSCLAPPKSIWQPLS